VEKQPAVAIKNGVLPALAEGLRRPTPKEIQQLQTSIEEAQWEARMATSYEFPAYPSECFPPHGWKPYECFECGECKQSFDDLKRHVLRSHGVVMDMDEVVVVGGWKCWYPSCERVFGDRQEGLRHARVHWGGLRGGNVSLGSGRGGELNY